ncbi:hypothetical protein GCM10010330_23010 [Streptomyces tendae]|nr:hypothetical protein GCM10010330_23010 [Streptomyces tendae]
MVTVPVEAGTEPDDDASAVMAPLRRLSVERTPHVCPAPEGTRPPRREAMGRPRQPYAPRMRETA